MRGYRRRFRADIPATVRGKCDRAGTEEDFAGIYPQPYGKSVAARVQKIGGAGAIRENALVLKYYERKSHRGMLRRKL